MRSTLGDLTAGHCWAGVGVVEMTPERLNELEAIAKARLDPDALWPALERYAECCGADIVLELIAEIRRLRAKWHPCTDVDKV